MAGKAETTTEELFKLLDEKHKAEQQAIDEKQSIECQNMREALGAPDLPSPSTGFLPISSSVTVSTKRRLKKSRAESETDRPNTPSDRRTLISLLTGEESDSDEESELYVQKPLPTSRFVHEDLRDHLRRYEWTEAGKILLAEIVVNSKLLNPAIFHEYSAEEEKSHHSHYTIFDVSNDGAPLNRRRTPCLEEKVDGDRDVWAIIRELNVDPSLRPVVGRISLILEPTPVILGALHLTMSNDFDMDEIFGYLMEENNSAAHMHHRTFSHDGRHQRSVVFKFDYFTVVGKNLQPMPWQTTDSPEKMKKRSDKHIPLSRCTSVVALSLSGEPSFKLRNVARRAKTKEGFVFDTWAPWHVLNIQCYPDHEHTIDSHDSTKHYVNGPEAFLHTLLAEFKDARKRFKIILDEVTQLVVPPSYFMFDGELRDKLLFEDAAFTYSRRYFWAFQTLGLISNGIKAIINEYRNSFTDDVWEGKHKSLWPLIEDGSHRNEYWRHRLLHLKKEFELELEHLHNLFKANEERRVEIKALESQLFQGTSVLESRKSVELAAVTILQGHNIKLLTLVTIFFLPLTFVTSVFGMANIPSEHFFKTFAITMATVCVPFFLLIGSLNTTSGMEFWRMKWQKLLAWIRRDGFVWNRPEPDTIGPGNPRVRRRSHTILQTAREVHIRKTEPRDEGLFHTSPEIRNHFSLMPHLREQDLLSPDAASGERRSSRGSERRPSNTMENPGTFMAGERRPSRGSERRSSNTTELKPWMPSITPASSKEEAVDLTTDLENPPSAWGRIRRKRDHPRKDANV